MNRDKFRYPMLVYLQEAPRARKRTVHRTGTVPVKNVAPRPPLALADLHRHPIFGLGEGQP